MVPDLSRRLNALTFRPIDKSERLLGSEVSELRKRTFKNEQRMSASSAQQTSTSPRAESRPQAAAHRRAAPRHGDLVRLGALFRGFEDLAGIKCFGPAVGSPHRGPPMHGCVERQLLNRAADLDPYQTEGPDWVGNV